MIQICAHTIIGSIAPFSLENPSQLFSGAFLCRPVISFLLHYLISRFGSTAAVVACAGRPCHYVQTPPPPLCLLVHKPSPPVQQFPFHSSLGSVHPPFCVVTSLCLFLLSICLYWRNSGIFHAIASQSASQSASQTKSHHSPHTINHPLLESSSPVCRQRQTVC